MVQQRNQERYGKRMPGRICKGDVEDMRNTIYCNVYYQPDSNFWQAIQHFNATYNGTATIQPINGGSNLPDDSRIIKDNSGDHISDMNKEFNEWTSLYWVWKNAALGKVDYVGHCHYRLYFKKLPKDLTADIYVSQPLPMLFIVDNNLIQTNVEEGYRLCHISQDWDLLESIIPTEDKVLFCQWKHQKALNAPCQMFLMKKDLFNEYMTYAWTLLAQLRMHMNLRNRDGYQHRALAFLGERILSFWTYKMAAEGKSVKELQPTKLEGLKPETATDTRDNFNF